MTHPFATEAPPTMDTKHIALEFAEISFLEKQIVELHFTRLDGEVKEKDVKDIFKVLKDELKGKKCYLLVSTITGAKMSQEAREFASSTDFNEVSKADAIIRSDYSHEMAANFFIRVNKPDRPVQLFPSRQRAESWLLELIDNEEEE